MVSRLACLLSGFVFLPLDGVVSHNFNERFARKTSYMKLGLDQTITDTGVIVLQCLSRKLEKAMDTNALLGRFTGPEKCLVRVLMSGPSGVLKASYVHQKQQRCKVLQNVMEVLCRKEIYQINDEPIKLMPLVCLCPVGFKQNLLSFIHLVHSSLAKTSILKLLECLGQEPCPNPWVVSLVRQLKRDMGYPEEEPLYTPVCSQRLNELFPGVGSSSWSKCFSGCKLASVSESGMSNLETRRKRKANLGALDSHVEETEHQCKRLKVASSPVKESHGDNLAAMGEELYHEDVLLAAPDQLLCPASQKESADLPIHIKDSISRIKELLECPTEWDQDSAEVFAVLNACDPTQVEMMCALLGLSDLAEQTLPKLCSSLLALSLDLSHSTAATLVKSLLLGKVLSLFEPASRCLVTAVTSLCCRYPRAALHALIRPVLEEINIGNPQAELVNRIIVDCLEPHYRLLVFEMMFKIAWSEAALSIIHSLLDAKMEFTAELFAHFTEHLVNQAPQFTKSMKFAKMMLTVLTKYNKQVTQAQKHSLSCCLSLNETFLKKSLQAALKRITHT